MRGSAFGAAFSTSHPTARPTTCYGERLIRRQQQTGLAQANRAQTTRCPTLEDNQAREEEDTTGQHVPEDLIGVESGSKSLRLTTEEGRRSGRLTAPGLHPHVDLLLHSRCLCGSLAFPHPWAHWRQTRSHHLQPEQQLVASEEAKQHMETLCRCSCLSPSQRLLERTCTHRSWILTATFARVELPDCLRRPHDPDLTVSTF